MVYARNSILSSNLRWNIFKSFDLLTEDNTVNTATTKVVVFIPPAVDPGFPPIIIRIIVNNIEPSVKDAVSSVLKPAVLGVTA